MTEDGSLTMPYEAKNELTEHSNKPTLHLGLSLKISICLSKHGYTTFTMRKHANSLKRTFGFELHKIAKDDFTSTLGELNRGFYIL